MRKSKFLINSISIMHILLNYQNLRTISIKGILMGTKIVLLMGKVPLYLLYDIYDVLYIILY